MSILLRFSGRLVEVEGLQLMQLALKRRLVVREALSKVSDFDTTFFLSSTSLRNCL